MRLDRLKKDGKKPSGVGGVGATGWTTINDDSQECVLEHHSDAEGKINDDGGESGTGRGVGNKMSCQTVMLSVAMSSTTAVNDTV